MKLNLLLIIGAVLFAPILSHAKINIFACEPEWAYLANQIGGDSVKTFSATTNKQNPHYISAKPSLMAKMRRADIVFCAGSALESGWLPVLLKAAGSAQVQPGNIGHFMASDYVQKLEVIDNPSLIDRSMGDIHPEGNPHVHLDPKRYLQIAAKFTQVLANIDKDNAAQYQSNLASFTKQWQNHIARWQTAASQLKGKKIIAYHKNYTYLADWLKLDVVATLEPKPGINPSVQHLSNLVTQYQNADIHKIIYASHESGKAAKWLSNKINIEQVKLPYSDKDNMVKVFDQIIELLK